MSQKTGTKISDYYAQLDQDPTDRNLGDEQFSRESLEDLHKQMLQLRGKICRSGEGFEDLIEHVAECRKASARNLLQYVSLRQQDLRSLQVELLRRGLSSLGRCEANVQATLNAVIDVLCRLLRREDCVVMPAEVGLETSRRLLNRSTADLFGEVPAVGGAHIMVTMPSEASNNPTIASDLVAQGMDCIRVNCAHDDAAAWQRMIDNLRRACKEQARPCKIAMDLAGPKLRTGPIQSGTPVLKWRPRRDAIGRVVAPARVWLQQANTTAPPPCPADAILPVRASWLSELELGDVIQLTDARGKRRELRIAELGVGGVWGKSEHTAYVTDETRLHHLQKNGQPTKRKPGRVGSLMNAEAYIVLRRGDRLLMGDDHKLGSPAIYDEHGKILSIPTIGCTLPAVFADLKKGDRVLFDDGKITSRVEEVHPRHVVLMVTAAGELGSKLRADKGINLPDTKLRLDALTDKDLDDLKFVVEHADMVQYSFVRRAEDVHRLQAELARLGRPDMPIVLKIENRQAFEHLPSLMLAAMQSPASGVMIARGDLAVEIGWQRLAEVQEEILWMCEAAHMPVVWATQVLENLAKTGFPSRAEITDAAMSVRAECVMLNKGPHIVEAVRVLGDILRRMQDHQIKKRPLLRRLKLADDLSPTDRES